MQDPNQGKQWAWRPEESTVLKHAARHQLSVCRLCLPVDQRWGEECIDQYINSFEVQHSLHHSRLAQHPIFPTLMNKPQNIWTPLPSALLQPRMHTPPSYPSFKPLHTRWRSGLDKPKRTASSAESIQKNLTASMMPRPSLPVDLPSAEGAVGLWCNVDHTAVKGGGLGGWNGFSWSYFLNMIYMTHLKCK